MRTTMHHPCLSSLASPTASVCANANAKCMLVATCNCCTAFTVTFGSPDCCLTRPPAVCRMQWAPSICQPLHQPLPQANAECMLFAVCTPFSVTFGSPGCCLTKPSAVCAECDGSPVSIHPCISPCLGLWDCQAAQHGHQVWRAWSRSL